MIEKTEFGVLISYEDWEIIQEKLERTDSSEVKALKQENANLRRTLNTMNSFLTSSAEVKEWSSDQDSNQTITLKSTSTNTASTKMAMRRSSV